MLQIPYIVADVMLQVLSSASTMTTTNFANHITSNFYSRTACWVRLQLSRDEYFAQLEPRRIKSWTSLLCRVALEDTSIQALLPSYTSLQQPPIHQMDWLQYLVATMQSLLGPLPVTDYSLKKQPWSYLSWLHLVLTDFAAAQDTPWAPKVFTLVQQSSNQANFVKINTTALHQ